MTFRTSKCVICVIAILGVVWPVFAVENSSLSEHIPEWELARFVLQQERLVLMHHESMVVVRIGEPISELPGVLLKAKNDTAALLELGAAYDGGATDTDLARWLLIRYSETGSVEYIEIRQETEAAQMIQAIEASSYMTPILPDNPAALPVGGGADGGGDGSGGGAS